MTKFTYDDVAEQGRRADAAELALLGLVRCVHAAGSEADLRTNDPAAQVVDSIFTSDECVAALKLLGGSKLRVIQDELAALKEKIP